jgi:CTP synthase
MQEEKLDQRVIEKLELPTREPDLTNWKSFVDAVIHPKAEVEIALVGKYVEHHDAYKSIVESFVHAGAVNRCHVNVRWIQSDDVTTENVAMLLKGVSGVLVAPGFGGRGAEGKLAAVNFARVNKIPFFGICLGMQCAVIEYARNVCNLENANSTEFNPDTPFPVIDMMPDQKHISMKGGTMRLGAYRCLVKEGTRAAEAYGATEISERHRHRFEVNNTLRNKLSESGMVLSGMNPEKDLVEIVEIPDHPWFVGVQFHPELKSTVSKPHPLFVQFVKAALEHSGKHHG